MVGFVIGVLIDMTWYLHLHLYLCVSYRKLNVRRPLMYGPSLSILHSVFITAQPILSLLNLCLTLEPNPDIYFITHPPSRHQPRHLHSFPSPVPPTSPLLSPSSSAPSPHSHPKDSKSPSPPAKPAPARRRPPRPLLPGSAPPC
jgi:hypothetical protein